MVDDIGCLGGRSPNLHSAIEILHGLLSGEHSYVSTGNIPEQYTSPPRTVPDAVYYLFVFYHQMSIIASVTKLGWTLQKLSGVEPIGFTRQWECFGSGVGCACREPMQSLQTDQRAQTARHTLRHDMSLLGQNPEPQQGSITWLP